MKARLSFVIVVSLLFLYVGAACAHSMSTVLNHGQVEMALALQE